MRLTLEEMEAQMDAWDFELGVHRPAPEPVKSEDDEPCDPEFDLDCDDPDDPDQVDIHEGPGPAEIEQAPMEVPG